MSLGGLGSSMLIEIGHVEAIFRYPVKSMGGERLEVAKLGWHGLDGDRRLAFRRIEDRSAFPWLTASKLADLLLFAPRRCEDSAQGDLPTHVRTPDGEEMPIFGEDLATEVGRRYGAPVQMMQLNHGIFDEASISVIGFDTVREIGRLAGRSPDVRRFRPNVVVRLLRSVPVAAVGGVAVARNFAVGGAAIGAHANDGATREFLQQQPARFAQSILRHVRWLGLLVLIPILIGLRSAQGVLEANKEP
jgi:uncharacterized protein YcbX